MSLVRYTPTPSDRMAALWTLLSVEDAVVLEYGPTGTARYGGGHYEGMGLNTDRLLSTHLGEDDVVMGDVSRLERALVEVDREYHPPVIFVVPSSILTVTGADIAGVCNYMRDEVGAELLSYEGGGFKGDYAVGLGECYTLLAKNLVEAGERVPNSFNLLGASAGAYRIESDLIELEDLMRRAFSSQRIATLGMHSSVENLRGAGRAAVNLVLRAEALPAARWLEAQCGTPYVAAPPYGYAGTLSWLEAVGEALGKRPDPVVTEALESKQAAATRSRGHGHGPRGAGHPVSVVGDYDLVVGLSEFARSIGCEPDLLACRHALGHIADRPEAIRCFGSERELIDALEALHGQMILADEVSLGLCAGDNKKLCVSAPLVKTRDIARHLPLMGERGADFLLEFFHSM